MPRSLGPINKIGQILPRRAREAMARAFKADRVLTEVDWSERRAYEERVARSEPSRAAGGEPTAAAADEEEAREPVAQG